MSVLYPLSSSLLCMDYGVLCKGWWVQTPEPTELGLLRVMKINTMNYFSLASTLYQQKRGLNCVWHPFRISIMCVQKLSSGQLDNKSFSTPSTPTTVRLEGVRRLGICRLMLSHPYFTHARTHTHTDTYFGTVCFICPSDASFSASSVWWFPINLSLITTIHGFLAFIISKQLPAPKNIIEWYDNTFVIGYLCIL